MKRPLHPVFRHGFAIAAGILFSVSVARMQRAPREVAEVAKPGMPRAVDARVANESSEQPRPLEERIAAVKEMLTPEWRAQTGAALCDQDGAVQETTLQALGIDPALRPEIQKIVDRTSSAASAALLARMKVDSSRPNARPGLLTYEIPTDPAPGDAIVARMVADFTGLVGAEKAAAMEKSYSPGRWLFVFGHMDLSVSVSREPRQVNIQAFDPKTQDYGDNCGGASAESALDFKRRFGVALDPLFDL